MEEALYIGRFQPFHLGHLNAVKQVLACPGVARVIIGIGSAENSFKPDNPFTAGERFQMIEAALEAERIPRKRYVILPVRNINNYDLWSAHVERLIPPFGKIFTGSSIVKALFEKHGGHEVKDIIKEIPVSSTEVRSRMLADENWQELVHSAVAKLLQKWNACERLKNIN